MTAKKKTARPSKGGLTYAQSGVDIDQGDALVERLAKTNKNIGGFSGAFPLPLKGIKKPVLLASTDGVGTKLMIAQKLGVLNTVGIDLVAMVVNDLIVCGALPLFFLDYYATGKLSADDAFQTLEGIRVGCEQANIPLLGGETAEMPGLYKVGDYDLAGFAVGLADQSKLIDGSKVKEGDVIIGIASSGVHSNGYSLVRAIVKHAKLSLKKTYPGFDEPLGEVLLRPTRIYVRSLARLLDVARPVAMAHITGGGLPGNLPRVLPKGCKAVIDSSAWDVPPIFPLLEEQGSVDRDEMFRVFNMGIGMVVVTRKTNAVKTLATLEAAGERAWKIGTIAKGRGQSHVKIV